MLAMTGSTFTFAFTSAALRSLRLDEERLHCWKLAQRVGPSCRPSPSALCPGGWGSPRRRMEPLACHDFLVQNALFAGDLEMVRQHFTESAAINLVIEAKGDELRWTSRKLGEGGRAQGWSKTEGKELGLSQGCGGRWCWDVGP